MSEGEQDPARVSTHHLRLLVDCVANVASRHLIIDWTAQLGNPDGANVQFPVTMRAITWLAVAVALVYLRPPPKGLFRNTKKLMLQTILPLALCNLGWTVVRGYKIFKDPEAGGAVLGAADIGFAQTLASLAPNLLYWLNVKSGRRKFNAHLFVTLLLGVIGTALCQNDWSMHSLRASRNPLFQSLVGLLFQILFVSILESTPVDLYRSAGDILYLISPIIAAVLLPLGIYTENRYFTTWDPSSNTKLVTVDGIMSVKQRDMLSTIAALLLSLPIAICTFSLTLIDIARLSSGLTAIWMISMSYVTTYLLRNMYHTSPLQVLGVCIYYLSFFEYVRYSAATSEGMTKSEAIEIISARLEQEDHSSDSEEDFKTSSDANQEVRESLAAPDFAPGSRVRSLVDIEDFEIEVGSLGKVIGQHPGKSHKVRVCWDLGGIGSSPDAKDEGHHVFSLWADELQLIEVPSTLESATP